MIQLSVHTEAAEQALAMIGQTMRDKAKLRKVTRPAAGYARNKIRTRPVPMFLVTPSWSKSNRKEKGFKKVRNYTYGGSKKKVHSGNLRKSGLVVPELKKMPGHVVGVRWGDFQEGTNDIGNSVYNARGWYGHMVDGGTVMRMTRKGKARGYLTAQRYIGRKIVPQITPKVHKILESGFIKLLENEKRKRGLD